jgi:hypothetical protein
MPEVDDEITKNVNRKRDKTRIKAQFSGKVQALLSLLRFTYLLVFPTIGYTVLHEGATVEYNTKLKRSFE